ncbi:MAG: MFS transporter [Chloroflexi bacterium]|nr:MFS transporter [Chloroflexota bacterium]MCY3588102.1 MFS transporter [Chloroflexota bacterium]MCY3685305.1 MFS transporter [Chloroflexota bacterium]MDE2707541.1 MFS transporter [Chloroflexota bacterium]
MLPALFGSDRKIFYGWYIVAAGIVINMLMGGLIMHAFHFYVAELKAEFLWPATIFGLAFMITRIESGVLGPVQGWLIDRFGPQTMMRLGIASTTIGLLAFSQLNSQATFIGFYFIVAIGASVGGFMTVSVAVVTWFERLRSRALGYMSTGFAFGGFLALPVGLMITEIGWRWSALLSAVVLFSVGQSLAFLFVRRPEDRGLVKDGEAASARDETHDGQAASARTPASAHRHRDFTAREALRTRAFWGLALAHGAPLLVVSGVFVHFTLLVVEIEGLTAFHAGIAYTVMNVAQLVGQLVMGYLGDRFSKRLLLVPAMIGHCAAAVLLGFAVSYEVVLIAATINGLAWGSRAPLITALRADYFGASNFGQIMGWSSVVMSTFMTVGGFLSAVLYDATGSYEIPFIVLGLGALTGALWVLMASRPRLPGVRVMSARGPLRRAQPIAMFRPNRPSTSPTVRRAPQRASRDR